MFVIHGLQGDSVVHGTESEERFKARALERARALLASATFEGDRVRVITSDGDHVWERAVPKSKRPKRPKGKTMRGTCYRYVGAQKWRGSVDDDWQIDQTSGGTAEFLGLRHVDGVRCSVWRTREGTIAQTITSAPPPKGLT